MKIVLLTASFPPPFASGPTEYLFNIVSHLPPHSVVVYTANASPEQAQAFDSTFSQRVIRRRFIIHVVDGHQVGRITRAHECLLWPPVALLFLLRERRDIVYLGEYNVAGVVAWLAKRVLDIPYVLFTYAEEVSSLFRCRFHHRLFARIARDADGVITVCEYRRALLALMGVRRDRILKILPAVRAEKAAAPRPGEVCAVRQKYGIQGGPILLTVGRLVERKGHAIVIEALGKLRSRFPRIRYVVVGAGPGGSALREMTRARGLATHVIFTGLTDDRELRTLYQLCDVFVMPHRELAGSLDTEGCPTVFLEAWAHGKPVAGGLVV